MQFPDLSLFHKSRTLKVLGWIFVTIFLGAIGSGLWELFLSRIYEWGSIAFLRAVSSIFHGYVDNLHRDIGQGQNDRMLLLPFILLTVSIIVFPWFFIFLYSSVLKRMWKRLDMTEEKEKKLTAIEMIDKLKRHRRWVLSFAIPAAILITLLYASAFLENVYSRKACIFVERSIDILAPHISQEKILQLRAEYRSVDNAQKFYNLESQLRAIAAEKKIDLPSFTVIK